MTPQHLTEEQLNTYLDGECNEMERSDAATHIALCAACANELRELRDVKQMMAHMTAGDLPRSFILPANFARVTPLAGPTAPELVEPRGRNIHSFEPVARLLSIAAVLAFLLLGGGQMAGWIGDDSNSSSNTSLDSETAAPASALQEEEPALARGELREQGDSAATGAGMLASQPARVDTPAQVNSDLTPLEITTVGIGVVALVAIASWILIHYRAGSAS